MYLFFSASIIEVSLFSPTIVKSINGAKSRLTLPSPFKVPIIWIVKLKVFCDIPYSNAFLIVANGLANEPSPDSSLPLSET